MNHKEFFKKHGKESLKDITLDEVYNAVKSRLMDETNLLDCNCTEEKKKVKRPGGWVCPAHGQKTVL